MREDHGMSRTPTYRSWCSMHRRCSGPGNRAHLYRDAGVAVCDRWSSFSAFLKDMGERPAGTSLDRFPDQKGNYEPGNCRWATASEQAVNRTTTRLVEWCGEVLPVSHWAKRMGISRNTLQRRLKLGWTVERAMTTPDDGSSRSKLYEVDGVFLTLVQASAKYGVSKFTLRTRLTRGLSMAEAVSLTNIQL